MIIERAIEFVKKTFESDFSGHDYFHTMRVFNIANTIAKKEGADQEIVGLSALLHDSTKYMNQDELCERYKIYLSQDDIASPATIHAITGAYYAREAYGADSDIFSAIIRHTVGGIDMTLMEKIIFASDYCEPTRNHAQCKASRLKVLDMIKSAESMSLKSAQDYALITFDYIIADILGKTISYLESTGCFIHPATIASFNDIVSKHKDNPDFSNLTKQYI